MDNRRHFQAWLRLARSLDWSVEHRAATCVRAFAVLQLAMRKCDCAERDENTAVAASKADRNESQYLSVRCGFERRRAQDSMRLLKEDW